MEQLHPRVTALVVTWNSAPHLAATLRALPSDVKAIVVDNASGDDSARLAAELGATIIEMGRNAGFPTAVNRGLQEISTPLVLLLNPDLVVDHDTIDKCVRVLESAADIGLVGPATVLPDGRPEPSAARHDRRAWHIVIESLGLVHLNRRCDLQMIHDRSTGRDVDAINGGFMLMRTALLRELGGLDESVFMYLEDMDLCRRVRDAGHRVRFVSDARAVHDASASTRQGDPGQQDRAYLHRIDADLEFLRRYGAPGETGLALAAFVLRSLVGLAVSLRRRERRSRYRAALGFCLRQQRGRLAPPPV